MADSFADGNTRVAWVPSIANIAAPTTTELNAGTLLQSVMTQDGLIGFEPTTADVDTASLNSIFNTVGNGRDSFNSPTLRLKKQSSADTAYTTLGTKGTTGYVVIRRSVLETTAWTSTQAVEVYPALTGRRKRLAPEANAVEKYEIPIKIYSQPNIDAVIA
jgi:hypothetical protein